MKGKIDEGLWDTPERTPGVCNLGCNDTSSFPAWVRCWIKNRVLFRYAVKHLGMICKGLGEAKLAPSLLRSFGNCLGTFIGNLPVKSTTRSAKSFEECLGLPYRPCFSKERRSSTCWRCVSSTLFICNIGLPPSIMATVAEEVVLVGAGYRPGR